MADKKQEKIVKRRPGRPRIHPIKDPNLPKLPVGRPRIYPIDGPTLKEINRKRAVQKVVCKNCGKAGIRANVTRHAKICKMKAAE